MVRLSQMQFQIYSVDMYSRVSSGDENHFRSLKQRAFNRGKLLSKMMEEVRSQLEDGEAMAESYKHN